MAATLYTSCDRKIVPFYGAELIAAQPALRSTVDRQKVYLPSEAKTLWVVAWQSANPLDKHVLILSSWTDENAKPQQWFANSQCSCGWHRNNNGTFFGGPNDTSPEFAATTAWRAHLLFRQAVRAETAWNQFLACRA